VGCAIEKRLIYRLVKELQLENTKQILALLIMCLFVDRKPVGIIEAKREDEGHRLDCCRGTIDRNMPKQN
jgi:hypothetical protein